MPFIKCCAFNAYLAIPYVYHCHVIGKRGVCELAHLFLSYHNEKYNGTMLSNYNETILNINS